MSTSTRFKDSVALLREAQAGSRDALSTVLARYRERLLGRIRMMMGTEARRSAESVDFLHGVMGEAIRDFDNFELRDERAFLRWMTGIARNRIRSSARRRREAAFADLSSVLQGPVDLATPSEEAGRVERALLLVEALEELPEDQRIVVERRSLQGIDTDAIAAELGRTAGAVRQLHNRALLRLSRILGRAGL